MSFVAVNVLTTPQGRGEQDLTHAGGKVTKHIYDYVFTDAKIERSFVTELDTSKEVAAYAKSRVDSS